METIHGHLSGSLPLLPFSLLLGQCSRWTVTSTNAHLTQCVYFPPWPEGHRAEAAAQAALGGWTQRAQVLSECLGGKLMSRWLPRAGQGQRGEGGLYPARARHGARLGAWVQRLRVLLPLLDSVALSKGGAQTLTHSVPGDSGPWAAVGA